MRPYIDLKLCEHRLRCL